MKPQMRLRPSLPVLFCIPIFAQQANKPVPIASAWIKDGRLTPPGYSFSIGSPAPESRWSYMDLASPGGEKYNTFVVEFPPNKKYVVSVMPGGRLDPSDSEGFLKGVRETLPQDWSVIDTRLENSDLPVKGSAKARVMMSTPKGIKFYLLAYLIAGRRNYLIATYSPNGDEPTQFKEFASSFSLLGSNDLPPAPFRADLLAMTVVLAVAGWAVDRRYKQRGGRKPTSREQIGLWIVIALALSLLMVFAMDGLSAEEVGAWMAQLSELVFALWQLVRWIVRRRYPLTALRTTVPDLPPAEG